MIGASCIGQFAIGQSPYPTAVFNTLDDAGYYRKKKRKGPDPLDLELAEKASRRAALELAVYGPEEVIAPQNFTKKPVIHTAPDVADLAKTIFSARIAHAESIRAQQIADDEDDLESILREIL